jgi:hypothetical protein
MLHSNVLTSQDSAKPSAIASAVANVHADIPSPSTTNIEAETATEAKLFRYKTILKKDIVS